MRGKITPQSIGFTIVCNVYAIKTLYATNRPTLSLANIMPNTLYSNKRAKLMNIARFMPSKQRKRYARNKPIKRLYVNMIYMTIQIMDGY